MTWLESAGLRKEDGRLSWVRVAIVVLLVSMTLIVLIAGVVRVAS